jgi:hypothetical protein
MKEAQDVTRAQENVAALQEQLQELEGRFQAEVEELTTKVDPMIEKLDVVTIKPKKTNVTVGLVALVWLPYWQQPDNVTAPAWE